MKDSSVIALICGLIWISEAVYDIIVAEDSMINSWPLQV